MSFEKIWEFLLKRACQISKKNNFNDFNACLKKLDNPHQKFKSIHIAGTNGKGSCANILTEIFLADGRKVGTYTSPHLFCATERIKINGRAISKRKFEKYVEQALKTEKSNKNSLTYFEILTATAFQIFADEKVDIAIIETGIGGRKDITNVINPEICATTSIGLDHTHILGDKITDIAKEKAGIIKKNTPCVIGRLDKKSEQVVRKIAKSKNAEIIKYQSQKFSCFNENTIQNINANICYKIAEHFKIKDKKIFAGIKKTKFIARFQTIKKNKKTYIVDGAHNIQAIENCLSTLPKNQNMVFVVCLMKEKNCQDIVKTIGKFKIDIIFTELNNSRCENAKNLSKLTEKKSGRKIIACKSVEQAMFYASDYKYQVYLGSFYLASEVLKALGHEI